MHHLTNAANMNSQKEMEEILSLVSNTSEHLNDKQLPLLNESSAPEEEKKTKIHKTLTKTLQSTAHLSNHLPTGTVLAFQVLSPIFTQEGDCNTLGRILTAVLIGLCGTVCFLLCFTDSFKDKKGNIRYGIVTFRGLYVIDGWATLSADHREKYKLKFMDFVHAFMAVIVFATTALYDEDVTSCFYSTTSTVTNWIFTMLPFGFGVISIVLFSVFPTQRHGIGFPLSSD